MSEVLSNFYSDAYHFAMSSGASEDEADDYARRCCDDLRYQFN